MTQGGPFTPQQIEEARKDPFILDKLAVRRWDDEAKVAGITVPSLHAYKDMAVTSLMSEYRLPHKGTS